MKKYILLALVFTMLLAFSGCSNNVSKENLSGNETYYSNLNVSREEKTLKESYKENSNLVIPSIEDAKNFNSSLKDGSVVLISKNNTDEIYNVKMLDKFIDSFNNGKAAYVRVIKATVGRNGSYLVNKLNDYETDGKIIKYTSYNKFIANSPIYFSLIIKTSNGSTTRYAVLESKDTPNYMGNTIVTLKK